MKPIISLSVDPSTLGVSIAEINLKEGDDVGVAELCQLRQHIDNQLERVDRLTALRKSEAAANGKG